jgi:cell division protein FtsI (penicillin-binding protein 3)
METNSGEIKAISNLGRTSEGKYYEKRNYAVYESHEPGSAFKLMSLVAALETKAIDTNTMVDTGTGRYRMYGRYINDSRRGGYGEISAARALEVSSNIAFARLIDESFNSNPDEFIDKLKDMHLHKKLGLPIKGEGAPVLPDTKHKLWSKNALPSISYGYNLSLTPLQTLTFYNAIANNGEMVKPLFVKAIKLKDKELKHFEKEVIDKQICSKETVAKIQEMLKNVVERGTGQKLYSKNFSMAGKTGTARVEYGNYEAWVKEKKYISSFTGYFPAENPKYSCIVVIHKPDLSKGYYGADVSGPVFKDIAQKIYTSNHIINKVEGYNPSLNSLNKSYDTYYTVNSKEYDSIPNVKGMAAMDAISLLENLGLKVRCSGKGKVKKQSVLAGERINKGQTIELKLG